MKSFSCMMLLLFAGLLQIDAQEFKQIQNRWKPTQYLHNEGGSLQVGPLGAPGWHSAHWEIIPVAGTQFVHIKNRFGNSFYLHNEYGKIQVGPLGKADWMSAQWELVSVPGTEFVQIRNRLKQNQYVHNQNGQIEVGSLGAPGWLSAQWKVLPVVKNQAPSAAVFLFIGDPQIVNENVKGEYDYNEKMAKYVKVINNLKDYKWPEKVQGTTMGFALQGQPIKPEFMVMGGDLTQWGGAWAFGMDGDALDLQWSKGSMTQKFMEYFDWNAFPASAIRLPMYIGLGNHDLNHDYENNKLETNRYRRNMRKYVEVKHKGPKAQVPVGNYDNTSGSFSWDAGGVHFVQLHRFGGDNISNPRQDGQTRPKKYYLTKDFVEANNSLNWLKKDLEKNAQDKHVVIFQHYGWDDFGLSVQEGATQFYAWWTPKEVEKLDSILLNYKVTRFHGHSHADQYYQHEDNYSPNHVKQGKNDAVFCVQAANPYKWQGDDKRRKYFDESGFLIVRVTDDLVEVLFGNVDQFEKSPGLEFTGAYKIKPSLAGNAQVLTSQGPNGAPSETMFNYQLSIKTGTSSEGSFAGEETAGTDSEVSMRLIGTKASSSMHYLNSKIEGNAFKANKTDQVSFLERDLGDIVQIEIKKDGQGAGPDWFVDNIDIQKTNNATNQKSSYKFYLNTWVKTTNSTVFNPGTSPIKYIVQIQTSDVGDAGTDANVYLRIFGDKGQTDEIRLNGLISGNAFERLKTDQAEFFATDVGTISKIMIRHDNSHTNPGWHLANVKVYKNSTGTTPVFFNANRWIESPSLSATLSPGPLKIDVDVTVRTSNIGDAGTDANVFVTVFGTKGNTGEQRLNGLLSGNAFERGSVDRAKLRNVNDIGTPTKVIIRHDNSGSWAGWHLQSVEVRANGSSKSFNCNCWVESGALSKTLK